VNEKVFFAAFATWMSLVVVATFISGLGNAYLSDRIGNYATHLLDVSIMTAATYGLTFVFVTAHQIIDVGLLFGIGIAWATLTVGLELLVGHVLLGEPWARLWRVYDIRSRKLYSIVLLALLISPYVASLHAAALLS